MGAGSEVIRLRACQKGDVEYACREAVIRLTGGHTQPMQVFEWREAQRAPLVANGYRRWVIQRDW
jgi:hypothetical protein